MGTRGDGLNYLRAHIHWRFRHAHHKTKDWLLRTGYQMSSIILSVYFSMYTIFWLAYDSGGEGVEGDFAVSVKTVVKLVPVFLCV